MLFGEKYGETVRVLDIGSSRELCGGTHVSRTGDIGLFKIVNEGGVAAGVRRIEAVTGANALAYLQELESTVNSAASTLKTPAGELQGRIGQVLEQVRALEKEVAQLKGKLASSQGDELVSQAVDVKGIKVLAARLDGADAKTLRDTMDKLKDKLKTAAIVLAAVDGAKVHIAAGVTADSMGKVKAGELVNFVAQQVGGKGGGKSGARVAAKPTWPWPVAPTRASCRAHCSRCKAGSPSGPEFLLPLRGKVGMGALPLPLAGEGWGEGQAFSKTRSHTPWPSLMPRFSNFVSGR
jgi:alanyl-tRNA synthetase